MTVELVGRENLDEVEEFLSRYEESAQFLINNLNSHGPVLTDHHNSGNFKLIRRGSRIVAVFCLARRGNLNIQSEVAEPALILDACSDEPIQIKGFIGHWDSVYPVYERFRMLNPEYSPQYESKEILYSYDLMTSDQKLQHDQRVRLLEEQDFQQWLEFSEAYMKELSLPDELSFERKKKEFEAAILKRQWWGLFDKTELLSRTALNSKGQKIGQVGGVFTPKSYRKQGLAKATMFHMLKDCRDIHGHEKSILFTGEVDVPAQKLYESMGYQKIGSFALILGS